MKEKEDSKKPSVIKKEATAQQTEKKKEKKFGTFAGVILPSILTILGAVMYYIAPQVVGGVGLFKTLLIILIAHSVTIATAFSISAIATNIKVGGGGLYYLISRSLGSEFGGSLGIQLYLAQTIASGFYAIAFARGISAILISFNYPIQELHIALVSLVFFGVMVLIGARFVVKLQFAIFAALILSLVSIFLGPNTQNLSTVFFASTTLPFWVAFAMFFPAVCGIDAGVGMSGELKNPRKSLVWGTFIAIILTMIVYISLVIKYASSATSEQLLTNPHIAEKIALFSPLVLLGILMATSSSALSSLMTAPRCFSAMSEDKILPRWLNFLGKKGKSSEPRAATILSMLIGIGIIMAGSLEFVSQIVAMFFLSVYGWINGAAFFEKVSHNPSYRPTFNPPWIISFYGMFAAYAIMYLFNPKIMVSVIVIQMVLFFYLYKSKKSMKIEGVWDGVLFQLLRKTLKRMDKTEKTKKNWRPTILAFSVNPLNNHPMAKLLHWIGSRSSITKMYYLIKGDLKNNLDEGRKNQESLKEYIKEHKLEIFPRSIISQDFDTTIENLIQAETIGDLPLNTVLVDFNKQIRIDKLARDMVLSNKNIIIFRNQTGFSNFKRVDVWWSSKKNGNLMLLLAYLITHSKDWLEKGAAIKVFNVAEDNEEEKENIQHIENMIEKSRMENIEFEVIKRKNRDIKKIMAENSEHSDLVIAGLPNCNKEKLDKNIIENINQFTDKFKTSLIVFANDKIDFRVN